MVFFTLHKLFVMEVAQNFRSCDIQQSAPLKCTYMCRSVTVQTDTFVQPSQKFLNIWPKDLRQRNFRKEVAPTQFYFLFFNSPRWRSTHTNFSPFLAFPHFNINVIVSLPWVGAIMIWFPYSVLFHRCPFFTFYVPSCVASLSYPQRDLASLLLKAKL